MTNHIRTTALLCLLWATAARAQSIEENDLLLPVDPQQQLAQMMTSLGFPTVATHILNDTAVFLKPRGALTLFAPTELAFQNASPEQRAEFHLGRHVARGAFAYNALLRVRDGTTLRTVSLGEGLLVTAEDGRVHVNGALVAFPDIFNDGNLSVHGVDRLLDSVTFASSLSYNSQVRPQPANFGPEEYASGEGIMEYMLRDAAVTLRNRGYSILALAMRLKAPELMSLDNFTVFTLSDDSLFMPGSGAPNFVNNVRYHVVPNRKLPLAVLSELRPGTRLETLLQQRWVYVTGARPLTINLVPLKMADVFVNRWMVVHEIGNPLWKPPPVSPVPPKFSAASFDPMA